MDNLVSYLGTINVQAKAMTDEQFNTLKGHAPSANAFYSNSPLPLPKDGYYVLFEGSNTPTWVDKETFEAKYSAVKIKD